MLFLPYIAYCRLSPEERKTYLDEADLFYQDTEGFLKRITLPQRLVFFDSLIPKLSSTRDAYFEVILFKSDLNEVCPVLQYKIS